MKALKYILLFLLLVIIAFSIYIATLDNQYDVHRTRTIKAPEEVVFNTVNNYKTWPQWSPWLKMEPDAKISFGDVSEGEGATYAWEGEIVGAGNIKTIAVTKDSIAQAIEFIKPFESTADVYWKFDKKEDGTAVTWGMKGDMDFMTKAYMAFSGGMDSQIGPDYEKGLQNLDSLVHASMEKYSINTSGITQHGGGYYLYATTSCKIEEIPAKMEEYMPKVGSYARQNNITMAGSPFALYHKYDTENNAVIMSLAVPISERVITDKDSGILTGMLLPFTAVKTTLTGNYKNLGEAWNKTEKYIEKTEGIEKDDNLPGMEVYLNDSMNNPNPADLKTEIFMPIKEAPISENSDV
ncbi:MAG: transcription activator effector-binding protein [Flavobacteriales bacterium]|nr:MAG: transcription activator effector-binding protein [Flavobacteriales bacterium]